MLVLNDRLYSENHIWIKRVDNELLLGVTDYAQDSIGDVEFLDLPEDGDKIKKGGCYGSAESSKAVTDMFSPLDIIVKETNQRLLDSPEMVNESPYENGWMLKVSEFQLDDLDSLMDAQGYSEYLKVLGIK